MKKRKVLFIAVSIFTVLLLTRALIPLKDTWKYRFSCILCDITLCDETYYSNATVSPDNVNVAYFKTEVLYINVDPIFNFFIGEGTSARQYYKNEKISLCTNNLAANSENCFKKIKNKAWQTPHQKDSSKESANTVIYWDKDGDIIYGVKLSDSVFGLEEKTVVGKINPKTHEESILSYDDESFQKLWSVYGQYINPNKILVSGELYGSRGTFYLIDTVEKNVKVYVVDPKIKSTFRMSTYINYEFFRKSLNDSRIK